jgi:hypothetical protein
LTTSCKGKGSLYVLGELIMGLVLCLFNWEWFSHIFIALFWEGGDPSSPCLATLCGSTVAPTILQTNKYHLMRLIVYQSCNYQTFPCPVVILLAPSQLGFHSMLNTYMNLWLILSEICGIWLRFYTFSKGVIVKLE